MFIVSKISFGATSLFLL